MYLFVFTNINVFKKIDNKLVRINEIDGYSYNFNNNFIEMEYINDNNLKIIMDIMNFL